MSEHSDTAADPTRDEASGDDAAADDSHDTATATARSGPAERPPSATRSGPDKSLRNFAITLVAASAVVVVAAYLLQGGLH